MAYADLRPMVLWGSWLDSEVLIGIDPVAELSGLDAADCWAPLTALPRPSSGFERSGTEGDGTEGDGSEGDGTEGDGLEGIGGGWVTVLGYDLGTSWLAFYDSLLRRRTDGTWVFESLGLSGREQAAAGHLKLARSAVSAENVSNETEHTKTIHPRTGRAETWRPRSAPGIGPLSPIRKPGLSSEHELSVQDDHLAGVERVIGRIRVGEVYQLNLCTRLRAELAEPPLELFVRTAGALRPAYGAHLPTGPDSAIASLSPERFLTVRDGLVTTSPIKGTTKRTEDPDGSQLRSSAKDAAENIMITDLMRNDLSRVCEPGSVTVTRLLEVQPHPGVWHLVSTVQGRLPAGTGFGELLAASFPPGSVTGAPKSSATAAIAVEEPYPRGAYTGAAGLITIDGRAELSVLIRTFEITGDQVDLGVGGGITVDSVPVREWQECLHKAGPLAQAAGSRLASALDGQPAPVPAELAAAGVFESVLVQDGRPLRLADHLARLARSVRELYAADLPDDVAAQALELVGDAGSHPRAALRVHARPGMAGLTVELSVRPLGPRLQSCTLTLATRPAHSWRHKWADRALLQRIEEQAAPTLPYFLDPSGRLAETSRGNVFVLGIDNVWRTPPATDWILPGVTRRTLLDQFADRGLSHEIAPVTADDLASARAVIWTSSLSGAVRVTQIDGRQIPGSAVWGSADGLDWIGAG